MGKTSYARLTPFARGKVVGMSLAGARHSKIRNTVRKTDGNRAGHRAIKAIVAHARDDPNYEGENSSAGGRPQELSPEEVCQLKQLVQEEVGIAVVTAKYCQKRLRFLRRISEEGVRRALKRLGLAWRLRRCKRAVLKKHKPERIAYCRWVLKQPQGDLNRWAYIDGTTFYLARDQSQLEDKRRAALGKYVWKMANGQDSLDDKNVGPSAYAKAQGQPIKIWGFFCDGHLEYYVLPEDYTERGKEITEHMTGERYRGMVDKHFADWRKACLARGRVFACKDFEGFLRTPETVLSETASGCDQLEKYPKASPDFNAIEGWWRRLKMYLEERAPTELETREAFLQRLRRAVGHLNTHCRAEGRRLCRNQKERARECLKLKGSRTKW